MKAQPIVWIVTHSIVLGLRLSSSSYFYVSSDSYSSPL